MASGLCHAVIDFLCYGHSHFDLHQKKDGPSQERGTLHRDCFHEWYQAYGSEWTLENPIPNSVSQVINRVAERAGPEAAEDSMAWVGHDVVDRTWDTLSIRERLYVTGMFVWVLQRPELLRDKFGVDVFKERIKRRINGRDTWEHASGLRSEYQRMLAYSKRVVENDPKLDRVLRKYGST